MERIYGRFPSVDPSGHFAGAPNLGKPLHREKNVYSTTYKTAINRSHGPHKTDVKHTLCKLSCFLLKSFS